MVQRTGREEGRGESRCSRGTLPSRHSTRRRDPRVATSTTNTAPSCPARLCWLTTDCSVHGARWEIPASADMQSGLLHRLPGWVPASGPLPRKREGAADCDAGAEEKAHRRNTGASRPSSRISRKAQQTRAPQPCMPKLSTSRPRTRLRSKALKFTGSYIRYARVLYMLLYGGRPDPVGGEAEDDDSVALGVYRLKGPPYNPAHR